MVMTRAFSEPSAYSPLVQSPILLGSARPSPDFQVSGISVSDVLERKMTTYRESSWPLSLREGVRIDE
jgi:hypothetical protein